MTWCNGQEGDRCIFERIDRMVCKKGWLDLFCKSRVFILSFEALTIDLSSPGSFKQAKHEECSAIIKDCWRLNSLDDNLVRELEAMSSYVNRKNWKKSRQIEKDLDVLLYKD
ncbi:conserved hypothetical protein [Ricinus communis]|uniref:Uncharacterized protein n=1 Tax=Ricinus communis TaxID=3988 RepID=B9S5H7_RICCO|nr:conserved hypothetical protein [Ricinus communis]